MQRKIEFAEFTTEAQSHREEKEKEKAKKEKERKKVFSV
jgi:hypothetical protein